MLDRSFYMRDTHTVAKELLGKALVHHTPGGKLGGMIVEVEAYMGPLDAAAHTYKNVRSDRTNIAYGPGGYAYVYLIYGMYHCVNIVTNGIDIPEMVLIRALQPIEGIEQMCARRKTDKLLNLCSGPGKLCMALGITREHYGADLCESTLYIEPFQSVYEADILTSPRVNIDYAGEAKEYPWRYYLGDHPFVSKIK